MFNYFSLCCILGVSSLYFCCYPLVNTRRPGEFGQIFYYKYLLNMMHFKSGLELTELQNMTVPEDDNISNDSNDFTEVENGQINR